MTWVALAFALGAALPQFGVSWLRPAPIVFLAIAGWRMWTWQRPRVGQSVMVWAVGVALAAGTLHGEVAARAQAGDCRFDWPQTRPGEWIERTGTVRRVEGPELARVVLDGPCAAEVRVRTPSTAAPGATPGSAANPSSAPLIPGHHVRLRGRWQPRMRAQPGLDPVYAGQFTVASDRTDVASAYAAVRLGAPAPGISARLARYRHRLAERLRARFTREAAMVEALIVARRGSLEADTREAFVRSGTTHLLAISGFHVGLLAGLVILTMGRIAPPGRAALAGTAVSWAYVALLGFPDAALRAGLLLGMLTLGRLLARPVLPAGALGTALLLLVLVDPGTAGRVGAQLSFAGAFALAVVATPLTRALEAGAAALAAAPCATAAVAGTPLVGTPLVGAPVAGAPPSQSAAGARGIVTALFPALAAGLAATLVTLPLVAWHFGRVSLVGIPATLVATPLIALALPAIFVTLFIDALTLLGLPDAFAALPALAVEGLLGATRALMHLAARPSWASVEVARSTVAMGLAGGVLAQLMRLRLVELGAWARVALGTAGVVAGVVLAPVVADLGRDGHLEVHMLDIGQGDALAMRSPEGRWVVVDAGPPPGTQLVRQLTELGVRRIDLLVLTHPDADHAGGAPLLLKRFNVATIAGPGTPRGTGAWREALAVAGARGRPWRTLVRGDRVMLDEVELAVLHPAAVRESADANSNSLVLRLRWGDFELLLTGDADLAAERLFSAAAGDIDVLKVGHHGSRTSTGADLLERTRPELALISAGRGNRFGHPHPSVLARLEAAGIATRRTDLDGSLELRVSADGRWRWIEGRVD